MSIPIEAPFTPVVNQGVHYVAYGTPGGEYPNTCRAADVTEVGAWISAHTMEGWPTGAEDGDVNYAGENLRTQLQVFDPLACHLFVKNPTGNFNNVCQYNDPAEEGKLKGGTWHWASPECM